MNKTEFRALDKDETLEFLLSKFDDPDGEFEAMSAKDRTQFGIDNWDEAWEESDEPEESASPDEAGETLSEAEGENAPEEEGETGEEEGEESEEEAKERRRRLDLGVLGPRPQKEPESLDLG